MHGGGVSAGERFKVGADDRFFPIPHQKERDDRQDDADAQDDPRQGTEHAPDGGPWRLSLLSDHAVSSLTRGGAAGGARRAPGGGRAGGGRSGRAGGAAAGAAGGRGAGGGGGRGATRGA